MPHKRLHCFTAFVEKGLSARIDAVAVVNRRVFISPSQKMLQLKMEPVPPLTPYPGTT
jgi:hypothetical protein